MRREYDAQTVRDLSDHGMHPVVARVLAARVSGNPERVVQPPITALDRPDGLPDLGVAVQRLVRALDRSEIIGICSDADVDGVTGHAVILEVLQRHFGHPADKVQSYIGHKMLEGYGLSDGVANRILAAPRQPSLVITSDCGSSDEARIARLRAAGIDTIVTDHHEIPTEGPPANALACVSPARRESLYPDRTIAGCMVSWLLLCALRQELLQTNRLLKTAPTLARSLDLVALGTVADCVSLARSVNNRAVVRYGLHLISSGMRPAWRAARRYLGEGPRLSAQDLAFQIGPRINARGRLESALMGVQFLLARDDSEAEKLSMALDVENERRKVIERQMLEYAVQQAEAIVAQGAKGIAVWLAQGHAGVHGIVASRLVERFGRPVACISPHAVQKDMANGSARGIPGIHVRDLLESVHQKGNELLEAFGGHEGAGGFRLATGDIPEFQRLFAELAGSALGDRALEPVIYSDGLLPTELLGPGLCEALGTLEPYGREFPQAIFESRFRVESTRNVGQGGAHLQMMLTHPKGTIGGIWFNAGDTRIVSGAPLQVAFSPELNWFNGSYRLQAKIHGVVEQH